MTRRMLIALSSEDLSDITPKECVEVSRIAPGKNLVRARNLYGEFGK